MSASVSRLLATCTNQLSILLIWFNGAFRYWTLEWEVLFILLLVVNINVAVLTQSVRALLVAGPVFVMMMYLYTRMGEIYDESRDFLRNHIPNSEVEWFKRIRKAYRPLRVTVASFYHADRSLILTMLAIITQYTANMVLTLKK